MRELGTTLAATSNCGLRTDLATLQDQRQGSLYKLDKGQHCSHVRYRRKIMSNAMKQEPINGTNVEYADQLFRASLLVSCQCDTDHYTPLRNDQFQLTEGGWTGFLVVTHLLCDL
jgi:hypothetical protein